MARPKTVIGSGNSKSGDAQYLDEEARSILYEGANISQLARLFEMDVEKTKQRMHTAIPIGMRGRVNIYNIADAAQRLVKPTYAIEPIIRRMNHADLPPALTKEFWAGQNSRMTYEKAAGNYWPTEDIIAVIANAFKVARTTLLLFGDTLELQTALTDEQRAILKQMIDGLLGELRANLVDEFRNKIAAARDEVAARDDAGSVSQAEDFEEDDHGL